MTDAVHVNRGLIDVLRNQYSLSQEEWNLVEEAADYGNDMQQIGDLLVRHGLEGRMTIFLNELKGYSMESDVQTTHFNLSERYPFEYVLAFVAGFLETPSEEGGYKCNSGNGSKE